MYENQKRFVSLWMFWGALQECLTMQAYEEIIRTTQNPVLAELFKRIAKQERRHFAYYFNQARTRPSSPSKESWYFLESRCSVMVRVSPL